MLLSILWIVVIIPYSVYHNRGTEHGSSHHKRHVGNYLIYGLCFFALGGGFLALFQSIALISYSCSSVVAQLYAITKIVYIISQVVLIAFCRDHRAFSKSLINGLFLYHTVTTNVVLYLTTFLESKKDFALSGVSNNTQSSNSSHHPNCTLTSEDYRDLFRDASLYLYPFFLEFTLTSSAMLAEFWMAASDAGHLTETTIQFQNDARHMAQISSTHTSTSIATGASHTSERTKLKLAVSTMIGLLAFGSFLLVIILMHYLSSENNPGNIFQVFNMIMSAISTFLCLVGLIALCSNASDSNNANIGLDEVLLITSVFGTCSLSLCNIYSASSVLNSEKDDYLDTYAVLTLVQSLMWMIQAAVQCNFIAKALHRVPKQVQVCCGIFNVGHLAVVLAFINLGMWLFNTIDLEGHYRSVYSSVTLQLLNQLQDDFFGKTTWTWIMLVAYPLAIFYRIHSVSTLYRVYKVHKELPTNPD